MWPCRVFQVDATVFDSDHCADIARLDILDHQAQLSWVLSRARLAPAGGENICSIAIHYAAILGSLAAQHRYGAPCTRRSAERG
jgi:hypothetical protein